VEFSGKLLPHSHAGKASERNKRRGKRWADQHSYLTEQGEKRQQRIPKEGGESKITTEIDSDKEDKGVGF